MTTNTRAVYPRMSPLLGLLALGVGFAFWGVAFYMSVMHQWKPIVFLMFGIPGIIWIIIGAMAASERGRFFHSFRNFLILHQVLGISLSAHSSTVSSSDGRGFAIIGLAMIAITLPFLIGLALIKRRPPIVEHSENIVAPISWNPAEPYRFHCPQCEKRHKVYLHQVGKRATCSCGSVLTIPSPTIQSHISTAHVNSSANATWEPRPFPWWLKGAIACSALVILITAGEPVIEKIKDWFRVDEPLSVQGPRPLPAAPPPAVVPNNPQPQE